MLLQGFFPKFGAWMAQRYKEFTVSAIPNEARMTSYCYVPKPILKMLKNPKRLKFVIRDGHIVVKGLKWQKLRIWGRTIIQKNFTTIIKKTFYNCAILNKVKIERCDSILT
ncbi:MAG: hypothetical protein OXC46_07355 [Thaumarchaeota archaeon]|nr:hypothetical protein [Nitrososphaerota archaeon]